MVSFLSKQGSFENDPPVVTAELRFKRDSRLLKLQQPNNTWSFFYFAEYAAVAALKQKTNLSFSTI